MGRQELGDAETVTDNGCYSDRHGVRSLQQTRK